MTLTNVSKQEKPNSPEKSFETPQSSTKRIGETANLSIAINRIKTSIKAPPNRSIKVANRCQFSHYRKCTNRAMKPNHS